MKIQKSWLLSFAMLCMFSFSAIASSSLPKEPVSIKKQFAKLLQDVEAEEDNSTTIYIDFMVNDKAEIIVLSTTSDDLDQILKTKLNYKTLETGKLDLFKKYTIPVTFTKE